MKRIEKQHVDCFWGPEEEVEVYVEGTEEYQDCMTHFTDSAPLITCYSVLCLYDDDKLIREGYYELSYEKFLRSKK